MKHSKRFWSDLFYVAKYEKVSDKAFLRIMLSSVFGILLCGICLAGLTWAWFTSSITSAANTITAAKFTADISVIEEASATPLSPTEENGKYTYSLSAGTKYAVTITASGDAEKYGGYCSVTYLRETPYHTVQLYPGSNEDKIHCVTFTVSASVSSSLIIVPQWGTFANTAKESLIENGFIISMTGASTEPQATVSAVSPESGQQATESGTTYAIIDTEQNSIPEASTAQPTAAENAVSEPSVSETPKQTEESSSDLSTQPTSQEGVSEKGTASEAQSVRTLI